MHITPEYLGDGLAIVPLEEEIYDPIGIDPALPQHPFLAFSPAGPGAGKSTVIQWLLCTHYNDFFNKIYIISSTINKDISWKKFKFASNRKFERYSDEIFKEIAYDISHNSENMRCLIIIDDMTGQNIWAQNTEFSKFVSIHRHCPSRMPPNICATSIYVIAHSYKSIPPKIRKNIYDLILFKIDSDKEVEAISEDNRGLILTSKDFRNIYIAATEEPHDFLYIKKKELVKTRFRKNFDILLKIDELKGEFEKENIDV